MPKLPTARAGIKLGTKLWLVCIAYTGIAAPTPMRTVTRDLAQPTAQFKAYFPSFSGLAFCKFKISFIVTLIQRNQDVHELVA